MRYYYRNGINCGANRREFEDQSVIKGKSKSNGIRPSWSRMRYFLIPIWRAKKKKCKERRRKKKKKKKIKKARKGMDCYGLYGY